MLALGRLPGAWAATTAASAYPFTLGVASGDPRSSSVVLWTRLARKPLQPDGGMGDRSVRVEWQVFTVDTGKVVRSGAVYAKPSAAHSVHVVATGLEPGRWYYYRFRALGYTSPRGRTRTMPAATTMPSAFRFAAVSCQSYEQGYYTAYRHLGEESLQLVVHLGDYIYENARTTSEKRTRSHVGGETRTLAEYRVRHAQYKTDPDLQFAHQRFPWMVTFDDHEVDNNWTGESNTSGQTQTAFLKRRAAALKAYYEHMPLRASSLPAGPDMQLYRRINVGALARISVLDTRQYRDQQVCLENPTEACADAAPPSRTMTGLDQERWLLAGMDRTTRWNVVAQQVLMARWIRIGSGSPQLNMDAWDGYRGARARILGHIAVQRPANPVVLTGDAHMHTVADLKLNFDDPLAETLATELVTTSITSGGDGHQAADEMARRQEIDPHVKYLNRERGYIRHTVKPTVWRADYRTVPYVSRRGAPVTTRASFVIRDGHAGAYPLG